MSSHDKVIEALRLQFSGLKRDEVLRIVGSYLAEGAAEAAVQGARPPSPGAVFPEGRSGNVGDHNGLLRTNYFNGRFLTAEDLRGEQVYWDLRARMDVQTHPWGIAWGLTLDTPLAQRASRQDDRYTTAPSLCSRLSTWPNLSEGRRAELARALEPELKRVGLDLERAVELCRRKTCEELAQRSSDQLEAILRQLDLSMEQYDTLCRGRRVAQPQPAPVQERWTLHPGLAFDGIGRPISVGAPFGFDLSRLIQRYRTRPTTVVSGGTQFAPCVCIDAAPPIRDEPGAAMGPGPYLLLLLPTEDGEGKAKVYGTTCNNGRSADACEVDGWLGGFELLLSRLPVDLPRGADPGAYRGLLSAWYFDVHEHNLTRRWERDRATSVRFPLDPPLWEGPGPDRLTRSAVPLALVFLGSDTTVEWVDHWIPRRPIASNGATAWAANVRGAPTASARIARVHQFQHQLIDHLQRSPHPLRRGPNLYDAGFRHLPPWGFLPLPGVSFKVLPIDLVTMMREALLGSRAEAAVTSTEIYEAAEAYFRGTNVLLLHAVALHEDEIFEDMVRADEKDPVLLQELPWRDNDRDLGRLTMLSGHGQGAGALVYLMLLTRNPALWRAIAGRQIELVRVVALLDAGVRVHPELAGMQEVAATDQAAGSSGLSLQVNNLLGSAYSKDTRTLVKGSAPLCRPWAFYVKERVEIAAWIIAVLERLVAAMVAQARRQTGAKYTETVSGRARFSLAETRASAASIPDLHVLGASLIASAGGVEPAAAELAEASPGLRSRAFWAAYDERMALGQERYARVGDARDATLDALAVTWPAAEDLKLFALTLPESSFEELRATLVRDATSEAQPLSAVAYKLPADEVFAPADLDAASDALEEVSAVPLVRLVKGVEESVTVGELIGLTEEELQRRFKASKARDIIRLTSERAGAVRDAALSLARDARKDSKVAGVIAEAREHERDLSDVIGRLKAIKDKEGDNAAAALKSLAELLDESAALRLLHALRLPERK